jgi:glycosyltransferase involved in cell wall biosynthesis
MDHASAHGYVNFLVCGLNGTGSLELNGVGPENIEVVGFETTDNPGPLIGMSDVMPYPSRTFKSLRSADLHDYLERFSQAVGAAITRFKPDIIHTHHLWLVSSIVKDLAPDTPVAASCHGSDLRQFHQCPDLRSQVIEGCRKIERICCLTADQQAEIAALYGIDKSRIAIVGAGYDARLFNARSRPERADQPPTIIYAGKLSRAKGIPWLLRALKLFEPLPFHLHLVGSGYGPEYRHCIEAAKRFGTRVSIHGSLPQSDLADLMRLSDLFILPSLFEGLPLVVLEALACGCRVIATDLPGCREIASRLSDRSIDLIPAPVTLDWATSLIADEQHFIEALSQALRPYLQSNEKRSKRLPDAVDLAYFNWESVFRRIEHIWRKMSSRYRHR